jgi:hypothetical protein
MIREGAIMKEQNNDKLQKKQQEQQPQGNTGNVNAGSGKGMKREAEDELLTTGGPVDRSAMEDADRGAIAAQTGGMSMKDEETNTSKDDFMSRPQGKDRKGKSARYGNPEKSAITSDQSHEDEDTSQDKTEGIVNPRRTMDDWAKFKGGSSSSERENIKARGKNNNDDTGRESNDIAPV